MKKRKKEMNEKFKRIKRPESVVSVGCVGWGLWLEAEGQNTKTKRSSDLAAPCFMNFYYANKFCSQAATDWA